MKKILLSPRLVLPLTIMLGLLVMGMRLSDVFDMLASGNLPATSAHAQEAPKDAAKDAPKDAPKDGKDAKAPEAAPSPPKVAAGEVESPSADAPQETDASPAEIEVLKQLTGRRDQLDKRAKDLDTREALLKITEGRVDKKVKDLEMLQKQLQSMVTAAGAAQQTQLDNLVKIYETMKPDDAAHIFEKLDMPVLLSVVQRMKPKSTAPIMAKMAPDKAKQVTDALTKQDQLPQIK